MVLRERIPKGRPRVVAGRSLTSGVRASERAHELRAPARTTRRGEAWEWDAAMGDLRSAASWGGYRGGPSVESPVSLLSVPGEISPYLNCASGPSRRRVRAALASAGGRERGGGGEGLDS